MPSSWLRHWLRAASPCSTRCGWRATRAHAWRSCQTRRRSVSLSRTRSAPRAARRFRRPRLRDRFARPLCRPGLPVGIPRKRGDHRTHQRSFDQRTNPDRRPHPRPSIPPHDHCQATAIGPRSTARSASMAPNSQKVIGPCGPTRPFERCGPGLVKQTMPSLWRLSTKTGNGIPIGNSIRGPS